MKNLLDSVPHLLMEAGELTHRVSALLSPGDAVWLDGVLHYLGRAQSNVELYFVTLLMESPTQWREIQPIAREVFDRFESLRCKTEELRVRVTGLGVRA